MKRTFSLGGTRKRPKYIVSKKEDRTVDGIEFDSKMEMTRYLELKMLERTGIITMLELQPQYIVQINGEDYCSYTADFKYYDTGNEEFVIEDVKSIATAADKAFRLRKKAAELYHGITVRSVIMGKKLTPRVKRGKKKTAPMVSRSR
ncbi:DUF1064 domain-containing protein [bacterium]|nr:DUF1064 domain-containing protein [bacterium]